MQYSPSLIEDLRTRLTQPLPGLDIQLKMAPPARGKGPIEVPDNARQSAVLVLLYPHEGKWYIPFMRRTEDGRAHSGQISFPGGGRDPQDVDYRYGPARGRGRNGHSSDRGGHIGRSDGNVHSP